MQKFALIVDDSKTAAVALSKMLDRLAVKAAIVESGEQALEYLKGHRPDVIFMDHMMPGMDGFEAVKVIKSNPDSAAIPIVMYTTKGGDMYVGQAKALGAVDILSKPATDKALSRILDSLPESGSSGPPRVERRRPGQVPGQFNSSDTMELDAHAIAMAADLTLAKRSSSRLALERTGPIEKASQKPLTAPAHSFWGSGRQWLVAILFLASSLWLLYLYLPAETALQKQRRENLALLDTLQWAMNEERSYDYGQAPLSAEVAELLQGWVPRLTRAGFRGSIVLEGHIGEFCLTEVRLTDGSETSMLPAAELPLSGCAQIGLSAAEAQRESVQQSRAFSEYVSSSGLLRDDAPIRIKVVPMGSRAAKYPYPTDLQGVTAGDWNSIALSNNRLRIFLVADLALN